MNHPLLEKLETYYIRFKEIGQLITDPEVIQDMERYVRLTKEYKELETITRTADKFKAALLSVEESKDILLHEEDKELREMAEMEIEELEDKLPGMEQELKLLLVPADSFGTPGYVRVSYCVQTEQIENALPAFKALAESYQK